jgi:hypothetical protein
MSPEGGVFLDTAYDILKEAGRPMHYREVVRIALERDSSFSQARDPIDSLGGVLYSEIQRGSNQRGFVKMGGGYFGLTEWSGAVPPPAQTETQTRRLRQTERPPIAMPPDITLEKLERIRQLMPQDQFRQDWGEFYEHLLTEERAKAITPLNDRLLVNRVHPVVQRIQEFLQGRSSEAPNSEVVCDWIFLCYTLELYREGAALWQYVSSDEVDAWHYQRTLKLSTACRAKASL